MSRLSNVILGCAISAPVVAIAIWGMSVSHCPAGDSILHSYQDFIAGCLALLGAVIGAGYLSQQIALAREQENERLRRRHAAARAIMPLALNSLADFCSDVAAALVSAQTIEAQHALEEEQGVTSDSVPIALPRLPEFLVRDFAGMIEAANAEDAQPFAELLSDLQVMIARLPSPNPQPGLNARSSRARSNNLDTRLFEVTYIHAAAGGLFEYARNISGAKPSKPSWDMIRGSMWSLHLYQSGHPTLYAMVEREKNLGHSPHI